MKRNCDRNTFFFLCKNVQKIRILLRTNYNATIIRRNSKDNYTDNHTDNNTDKEGQKFFRKNKNVLRFSLSK